KSASYLLHNGHFASVRKLLLDTSATILQDDSGIPLAYFEAKKWQLKTFGHYAGPIPMFANFYQPRMAEVFQGSSPIEFGIGYRWRKNESNLLLAQKEPTATSGEEVTSYSSAEVSATGTIVPVAKKDAKAHGTRSDAAVALPNCEGLPVLLVRGPR